MFFLHFYLPSRTLLFCRCLTFVGTTLESAVGLPLANLPAFLMFFIPGALFLLVLVLRDLHAHSRSNPNDVVE